ncbi:MAG TPA: EF-hand domain-containing protein [Steroidobacteraceae bacterium]|nr:EF-hand domain-containing protein [Steroidobacteraceae bacterium]
MKTTFYVLGLTALLAGTASAGEAPKSDAPRGMKADTDGDGRVSRAEATSSGAERSGEWFDKIDSNKDGYLTQEEMKQARATRQGKHGDMKQKMEQRFTEADANADGQISLDEAQAKMPRVAERFSTLDTDKNGLLSKEELKHGAPRHKPQPQS